MIKHQNDFLQVIESIINKIELLENKSTFIFNNEINNRKINLNSKLESLDLYTEYVEKNVWSIKDIVSQK